MKLGFIRYFLIAVTAIWTTGCASIISGSSQEVGFRSSPEGATVSVNGRQLGKTPLSFQLKKERGQTLTFEKEGYKPMVLPLSTRMDGWFWGNLVIGGLVGSTTDGISGAIHEYSPSQYLVTLEPLNASSVESEVLKEPRLKAREFIIIGYRSIIADLKAGKGEYASSLLEALKVPKDQRTEAITRLNALAQVYKEIPDFAQHAVDLYLKPGTPEKPLSNPEDWEKIRTDGTVEDVYNYLVADDPKEVLRKTKALRQVQREGLVDFILARKGNKSMSWRFVMGPAISDAEKRFISLYLRAYSDYLPE